MKDRSIMHADLLIVTVTKIESESLLKLFQESTGRAPKPLSIGRKTYHDLGTINDARVFMVRSEMGSGGLGAAQQTVEKGIAALSPSAVIMVGIAFGIDSKKQAVGDILIAQRLSLYELQKIGTKKTGEIKLILRGDRPHSSTWLFDRFQSAELYWKLRAKPRFGLMFSGEKLIDNVDFREQLKKLEPEAIGGEMEGAGLYVTCQDNKVDWILVKAIADWADGRKNYNRAKRQQIAACNAARFVLHMLQHTALVLPSRTASRRHLQRRAILEKNIQLSAPARIDCEVLHIAVDEPIRFILGEAIRHPLLFSSKFTSLSLVFHENVLLLSWDGSRAIIERVLSREKAYPLNDVWTRCLAAYRKATLLPYRLKGPEQLFLSTEFRRALAVMRALISETHDFLRLLKNGNEHLPDVYRDLNFLIDEADFAFNNEDIATSIARLEAVLSTIHKLILEYAPQGPLSTKSASPTAPKVQIPTDNKKTILIVDDVRDWVRLMQRVLKKQFVITVANSSADALKALVEQEFDLVITDLLMPGGADGREIAMAAKKSSEKTKVIVLTGYPNLSKMQELFKIGIDDLIFKGNTAPQEISEKIKNALR